MKYSSRFSSISLLLIPILFFNYSYADTEYKKKDNSPILYSLLLSYGYANGGDKTTTLTSDSLVNYSNFDAGYGNYIEAGVDIGMAQVPYFIETTYAIQSSKVMVLPVLSNSEFSKQILNIVPSYRVGSHLFGLGLTYHRNPEYYYGSSAPDVFFDEQLGTLPPVIKIEYQDSLGMVFQYTYGRSFIRAGVRFTVIDYESSGLLTTDPVYNATSSSDYSRVISGNSVGLFLQFNFPARF